MRELLAYRARLGRTRTAVINELHALYVKRNVEAPSMIWHRLRPMPWRAEELSGYAPHIVRENVGLLKVINRQIQDLDKELGKAGFDTAIPFRDDFSLNQSLSAYARRFANRYPRIIRLSVIRLARTMYPAGSTGAASTIVQSLFPPLGLPLSPSCGKQSSLQFRRLSFPHSQRSPVRMFTGFCLRASGGTSKKATENLLELQKD